MSQRRHLFSASPYEKLFGFSRALRVGRHILVAGTAPIGVDGKTFAPGDAAAQARRCFEIAVQAIGELGGGPEHVVRTRMMLTDIGDWEAVGRVHAEFFSSVQPAATMVEVARLIDPEWRIEIEVDAILDGEGDE